MTILDHPQLLVSGSATRRGLRSVAADAVAVRGGVAAVADGVGDTEAAALAARGAVDVAVHVLATGGRPVAAVLAAAAAVRSSRAAGDAVLVVAAPRPGGGWDVAWVGDPAAVLHDGRVVRPVTHEHTVGAQLRAQGVRAAARWDHVVTTSLRTARPDEIGVASCPPGTLLLLSDGVHRALEPGELAGIVTGSPDPVRAAARLVDGALAAGARDNVTAAVLRG